ncbi:hypothetical protein [Edaphosphingomonas haloaromaticamans]|uniref:DUF1214 domain-containing protein n=1 Tax=Edaphosphingomonas haloaromaticamans TaxID=653954 RepID=A0A1S1HJK5_9SPHN|nr:hypothetical protein [Sphingomonas haloaromaticamans]OHT22227.1 hypothetical protein BHE75_04252 [Sphingomonas haloaromaticamans]
MTDTTSETARQRLLSGKAWDDFCETIRRTGHMVDRFGEDADALDRAEWYRFMTRLMRNGFERFMENCEPDRPRLRDAPWRQGINFQSPDQDHLLAEFVDGSADYRITGNRGTIPYFVMAAWEAKQPADIGARDWAGREVEGLAEFDPATLRTTGFLQSDAIRFDANGDFEVIVSRNKPAGDVAWLPITDHCVGLLVRTVYHDRGATVPPVMRIERLDGADPRPIRPAEMSDGLAKAGQLVLAYAELVRSWWQDNLAKRPNRIRFSRAVYLSNGGVPDRHHGFGTWQKAPGEAIVLRFTPTPCDYWIFQLCNIWQENLDNYEDGQGYVQKYTARYESDGSVLLVVADEDPRIGGNWIDPFGHAHGGWSLRLIKTEGDPPPVTLYRLPLAALKRDGLAAVDAADAVETGEISD